MNKDLALGIDIGGTNSVFGLCDKDGKLVYENTISTKDCATAQDLVEKIYKAISATTYSDNILGIGIGAPNGNYFTGTIEYAPNLNWKGIIPLAELFETKFKLPTVLTNDANAAAIGEKVYGAAKDLKDFVTITLGTGVGSGVIVNGNLVYGQDGSAGEYGHIRVVPNGRTCGCGRKGCLETYSSSTGVVRSIKELDSENKSSSALSSLDSPTAKDVFYLSDQGDLFAQEIVEFTAKILGNALADFACFSSPSAYILFGGLAQSGSKFKEKVKSYMEDGILNLYKGEIEIRISELHDQNAAVLGASSLVWQELK